MKTKTEGVLVVSLVCIWTAAAALAQQQPGAIAPAEKLAEGWEEIDQRLVFLMVRLANVETSLDAVEKAIGKSTGKRSSNLSAAKRAEAGNERMDRQGGGPMKWSEFYGRTAEKFFYHPTDRNTSYHTTTVLSQQGPQADNKVGGGVPAGQGLPVHQRPPQFDYIYRANENAKAKAEEEASELKGKVEALIERRQRLEIEQAGLWCEVAFRAVSHYDLDKKPLYRFEPLVVAVESESRQRAETMKAAASFMALALSIIDDAQKDQATTFSKIKPAVSQGRQTLNDTWLRQAVDVTDRKTTEGKFAALAKRLDDVASNLSDSYVVANEGDQAKDQQRKNTFRALLQESLVGYAQIILALDEMSVVMKDEWKIKPDVDRPIQFVSLSSVEGVRPAERPLVTLREPVEADPNQRILKALQGEWQVISEEVNGEVYPKGRVTEINRRIRIKDNALSMSRTMQKFGVYDGHFEIDAGSKNFDWSGKAPGGNPTQFIGIFDLDGDRLKLCYKYVKDGTTRPTAFKTQAQTGSPFVNLVLKRVR
jgi:uncharacterized protein (TIGR03067 family)